MLKAVGALLLLAGGLWLRQVLLQRRREHIALGEELCLALDRLQQGIYRLREPLPQLLRLCREELCLSRPFWEGLLERLSAEGDFPAAWEGALTLVPPPYGRLLAPLGAALPAGEREDLFLLTREEVYRAVQEERRQQGERDRLATALCLSTVLLVIVVLL